MITYAVRGMRRVTNVLLANDAPHQLALGFALGMVLGLMPKGNLVAMSLCVLLFSLRVNTGLGLMAMVLFSCVAPWVDPIADKLGQFVLTANGLQSTYAAMFQMPLGPWLDFQNTIVTGSLLVGLYLAYPAYWLSYVFIRRLQPQEATARKQGIETVDSVDAGSALYHSSRRDRRRVA